MKALRLLVCGGWLAGCTVPALPYGDATLYVVGRGWHTDIGIPVEDAGPLATLERDFPGVRIMVFGFGERDYYMAQEGNIFAMLKALLPSESAILLTALRAPPEQAFAEHEVATLHLPRAKVQFIASLIWQALETLPDGTAVQLGPGPYPGSMFYASSETYDAFNTCNTWTARMLRDGGVPVNPHAVLFAGQVMQQVAWIAAMQAGAR